MLFALRPAVSVPPSASFCSSTQNCNYFLRDRPRGLFLLLLLLAALFLGNLSAANAQFINFSGNYYAGQPVPASSAPNPGGVMPASGTTPSATSQDTPDNQYVSGLTMDFLKSSPPVPIVAGNGFSVRWTASFRTTTSGSYTFSTTSSAGVRVSINGTKVIDNWYLSSFMSL